MYTLIGPHTVCPSATNSDSGRERFKCNAVSLLHRTVPMQKREQCVYVYQAHGGEIFKGACDVCVRQYKGMYCIL